MKTHGMTSPMKLTLEVNGNIATWEGSDSNFITLFRSFLGLCTAVGFPATSTLHKKILKELDDNNYTFTFPI